MGEASLQLTRALGRDPGGITQRLDLGAQGGKLALARSRLVGVVVPRWIADVIGHLGLLIRHSHTVRP